MAMTVCAFSRDLTSGTLSLLQTISMLPPGVPPEPNTSAEIACHPSGHYLYISNRTIDTLSSFRIATDGTLDTLKSIPSIAKFPRSFALDHAGKWMIVAGQKSNDIVVFRIDPLSGELTPTDQTAKIPSPVCVLFAD
jgi:6-phosphogluconolactonase